MKRGETFCVIGENGSGKSTFLQIVAGILQPTTGIVEVHGRVSALLELGAGFNPEFTGRQNVYLNGAILGLSTRQIDERYGAIAEFAEIGDFIDQPVKTYSSGMVVRLAFAVAINVDPEILLVDEALAVGDIYFRQRCMRKVHELRSRGVTILFVSHAIGDVKAIGDRRVVAGPRTGEGTGGHRPRGGQISGRHDGKRLHISEIEKRTGCGGEAARAGGGAGGGGAHPQYRPSLRRRTRGGAGHRLVRRARGGRRTCWSRADARSCASACGLSRMYPCPLSGS